MEFYYLVLCMLLELKSDEMRRNKVLKYQLERLRKRKANLNNINVEIRYQKCSIKLLNKIIRRVKKLAKGADLDDFKKEEDEDSIEEN